MAFCPSCCSEDARTVRITVPATDLGLPSGSFVGVESTSCDECGEETMTFPAHGAAMKEYRKQLAQLSRPLAADEFAYLRRTLGVTGKGYAEALGVSNVTISRVENGEAVPALQDALARTLTILDLELENVRAIARLMDRQVEEAIVNLLAVEKSRPLEVSSGWMHIDADVHFSGNVVPIRRKALVRMPVDVFEFEAPIELRTSVCR